MENIKTLIEKTKQFDYKSLDITPSLDTRLKVICHANDIFHKIFKKSIVDFDIKNASTIDMLSILYIILIIFKKYTVVYDFKKYIEPFILNENTHYLESTIYNNNFEELINNNNNIFDTNQALNDIDVVFSSGGNAGFLAIGIRDIINKLKHCNIHRVSGVSIGAWISFFYFANIDTTKIIDLYLQINAHYISDEAPMPQLHYMYEAWGSYIKNMVDVDMYKKCNNRLFIGYTELNSGGAEFKVKSNYSSNDDVFMTCIASAAIPFMSIDGACVDMDGKKTLDGGLLKSAYFFDDAKREQLHIDINSIEYAPEKLLLPIDKDIHSFIYSGAEEMVRFLKTGDSKIISLIKN